MILIAMIEGIDWLQATGIIALIYFILIVIYLYVREQKIKKLAESEFIEFRPSLLFKILLVPVIFVGVILLGIILMIIGGLLIIAAPIALAIIVIKLLK